MEQHQDLKSFYEDGYQNLKYRSLIYNLLTISCSFALKGSSPELSLVGFLCLYYEQILYLMVPVQSVGCLY
jgi:hypothetical protein